MEQWIEINGRNYVFAIDYKDNEVLRKSFNKLTQRNYGFDLEQWYQDGYWTSKYVPYSILDGNDVIANVSVNFMDFLIEGKEQQYIQIGTVMTDSAYRNQGISRILIEKVLADCEKFSDFIYLFANSSVLEFYPKFGFQKIQEYQYYKPVKGNYKIDGIKKLNILDDYDRNLLYDVINNTVPNAKISMIHNLPLLMFYCTGFMKDNLYYSKDTNTIVLAEYELDKLHISDVFSTDKLDLDRILHSLCKVGTKEVILGFAPLEDPNYLKRELQEDTLFVKTSKNLPFKEGRFPELSHA
jgi:predicted GNAT family N-acyltransferase